MKLNDFFKLFEAELKTNDNLRKYHRFANSIRMYNFRKSYILRRYEYLINYIPSFPSNIWDVGCGYGTTTFLLAALGHNVLGSTLEYYAEEFENRVKYWDNYIDTSAIKFEYSNIFDTPPPNSSFDAILAIDTLHHLEPLADAVNIFYNTLGKSGKIIVCEENGNNLIQNLKNFKQRGNKRIINIFDEKLQKHICFGNENTRSLKKWEKEFEIKPFAIDTGSIEYLRVLPPFICNKLTLPIIAAKERRLADRCKLIKEYFFFGINFVVHKKQTSYKSPKHN